LNRGSVGGERNRDQYDEQKQVKPSAHVFSPSVDFMSRTGLGRLHFSRLRASLDVSRCRAHASRALALRGDGFVDSTLSAAGLNIVFENPECSLSLQSQSVDKTAGFSLA